MSKDYCVILAGGTGRRLWPASGKALPKQFVDIFGIGSTLLQLTYERFARFIEPDHIYVSTFVDYIDIVERQLPDLPRRHILAEPVRLGTAPAVAWANSHIIYKEPDARVVVSPADQYILRSDVFESNVRHALDFVDIEKELDVIEIVLRDLIGHRACDAALADAHVNDIAHQSRQRELAVRLREQQYERYEEVDAVSLHESEDLHGVSPFQIQTRWMIIPLPAATKRRSAPCGQLRIQTPSMRHLTIYPLDDTHPLSANTSSSYLQYHVSPAIMHGRTANAPCRVRASTSRT